MHLCRLYPSAERWNYTNNNRRHAALTHRLLWWRVRLAMLTRDWLLLKHCFAYVSLPLCAMRSPVNRLSVRLLETYPESRVNILQAMNCRLFHIRKWRAREVVPMMIRLSNRLSLEEYVTAVRQLHHEGGYTEESDQELWMRMTDSMEIDLNAGIQLDCLKADRGLSYLLDVLHICISRSSTVSVALHHYRSMVNRMLVELKHPQLNGERLLELTNAYLAICRYLDWRRRNLLSEDDEEEEMPQYFADDVSSTLNPDSSNVELQAVYDPVQTAAINADHGYEHTMFLRMAVDMIIVMSKKPGKAHKKARKCMDAYVTAHPDQVNFVKKVAECHGIALDADHMLKQIPSQMRAPNFEGLSPSDPLRALLAETDLVELEHIPEPDAAVLLIQAHIGSLADLVDFAEHQHNLKYWQLLHSWMEHAMLNLDQTTKTLYDCWHERLGWPYERFHRKADINTDDREKCLELQNVKVEVISCFKQAHKHYLEVRGPDPIDEQMPPVTVTQLSLHDSNESDTPVIHSSLASLRHRLKSRSDASTSEKPPKHDGEFSEAESKEGKKQKKAEKKLAKQKPLTGTGVENEYDPVFHVPSQQAELSAFTETSDEHNLEDPLITVTESKKKKKRKHRRSSTSANEPSDTPVVSANEMLDDNEITPRKSKKQKHHHEKTLKPQITDEIADVMSSRPSGKSHHRKSENIEESVIEKHESGVRSEHSGSKKKHRKVID